jgi:hypothetical protein
VAHHAIQPAVAKDYVVVSDLRRQILASGLPLPATDLEEVRIVGLEVQ